VSATTKPTTEPVAGRDLIDVNVHLDRWPFRRLPLDEPAKLVAKLRAIGVKQAWAGSFDAILHRDIAGVNERLVATCREHGGGRLLPFGAINPMLPDWEEDIRRCADVFKMRGIRLYPNYHGYKLEDPAFAKLLDLATAAKLIVQVAVSMEDERTQHPLVRVPVVDVAPLAAVIQKTPAAKVVLLNAARTPRGGPLSQLAKTPQVSFDIAALENVGGIEILAEQIAPERILFGTHAPFYYPESAVLKLREAKIAEEVMRKITVENAKRMLL
jgi:predicted TIM-barrel fold metal-dependent hydrolase